MAISQFIYPKIKNCNEIVEEQQKELRRKANDSNEVRFVIAHKPRPGKNPIVYSEIGLFLGFAISLLKTRKFSFSLFGTILYIVNFSIADQIYFHFIIDPTDDLYVAFINSPISVLVLLIASFWQAHLIIRHFQKGKHKELQ